MNVTTWISLGIVGIAIDGILLLLNQITKPYDVKTEEEFEKRRKESAGFMVSGMRGIQELLDPSAKKATVVQQDLRRGIYDDHEEADDPPEGGGRQTPTSGHNSAGGSK